MSEPNDREHAGVSAADPAVDPARRNRIIAITAGAVVIAAGIVTVLVMTLAPNDPTAAPTPSPSTSESASETPTPEPSDSATPDPTDTPVPAPTEQFGQPANPPVAIDEPAAPRSGVTAAIDRMEAVDGEANTPGDIAGPSVRFRMTITNTGTEAVDLTLATVNAYYGTADTPANALSEPGGQAFPTSVAPGQSATGVFLFTVPDDQRDRFTVTLDLAVGTPLSIFQGPAPRG